MSLLKRSLPTGLGSSRAAILGTVLGEKRRNPKTSSDRLNARGAGVCGQSNRHRRERPSPLEGTVFEGLIVNTRRVSGVQIDRPHCSQQPRPPRCARGYSRPGTPPPHWCNCRRAAVAVDQPQTGECAGVLVGLANLAPEGLVPEGARDALSHQGMVFTAQCGQGLVATGITSTSQRLPSIANGIWIPPGS